MGTSGERRYSMPPGTEHLDLDLINSATPATQGSAGWCWALLGIRHIGYLYGGERGVASLGRPAKVFPPGQHEDKVEAQGAGSGCLDPGRGGAKWRDHT